MNAKKFTNFSKEDFTWKHNGIPFHFPAGSEMYLEDDKADHFAKHLVDREIGRMNIDQGILGDKAKEIATTSPRLRAELHAKCFPTHEEVTPAVAIDINEKAKRAPKQVESEFEDLKIVPRKKL